MEAAISSLKLPLKRYLKCEVFRSEANYQQMSFSCLAWYCSFSSFTVQDFGVADDAISSRQTNLYILSQYQTTEMRNQEKRKRTEAKHTV